MSDPENETATSVSVTSENIECQVRAVTDPLTQQLVHFCELMKEIRDEQAPRRHQETTSSRAASTSTSSTIRSDMVTETANPVFSPLSTLAPTDQLTFPELPPHH